MKYFISCWFILGSIGWAAGLKFEKEVIDVHADLDSKEIITDFKFTNNSSKTIKIKDADAGCSCLGVQVGGGKLSYAPGEAGTLRTTFELGSFQGVVDKPIYVWLDDDPEDSPSSTINLRVHIPVAIKLEPKTLKWKMGAEPEPMTMDIVMDYDKPIKVLTATVSNTLFKTKLITVEEGKHYQVEVTPLKTDSPSLAIIRIETDMEVEKQRVQQGFGVIQAPLKKVNP